MADALATPARKSQQIQSTPAKPRIIAGAHDRSQVARRIVKGEKVLIPVHTFLELLSKETSECPELDPIKEPFDIVEHLNCLSGVVAKADGK
jgi:hypothetical protein